MGERIVLDVIGTYADGSTANLTKSSQTNFTSESAGIVTVDQNGLLTAVAPGSTRVIVNNSVTIPVTVDQPVIISPAKATLRASQTRQFVARLTTNPPNNGIVWSINPPGVGSIENTGLYTAPATIASQQIVTLTATSIADNTQTATATVTLSPAASIQISPGWATVYPGQNQQFTATTSNVGTAGVTWSTSPQWLGSIGNTGTYTAPPHWFPYTVQRVVVTATSAANPSYSASVTFWISPPPFLLLSGAPGVSVPPGNSVTLGITELAADRFGHPVALSVSGLPAGVTGTFAPGMITGSGGATLTLTAAESATQGNYSIRVTGTDTLVPSLTASLAVLLGVNPSQGPMGFSLSASSQDVTALPGSSNSLAITEASNGQFAHIVGLSASGLPAGVTAAFTPNPLPGSGSGTLNLTVGSSVANGVYSFIVTGTEAATGTSRNINLTLIVRPFTSGQGATPFNKLP